MTISHAHGWKTKKHYIVREGTLVKIPKEAQAFIPGLDSCTGITLLMADGSKICAHVVAIPYGKQKNYKEIEKEIKQIVANEGNNVRLIAIQRPADPMGYFTDINDVSTMKSSETMCDEIIQEVRRINPNVVVALTEYGEDGMYVRVKEDGVVEFYDKSSIDRVEKPFFGDTIFNIIRHKEQNEGLVVGEPLQITDHPSITI